MGCPVRATSRGEARRERGAMASARVGVERWQVTQMLAQDGPGKVYKFPHPGNTSL